MPRSLPRLESNILEMDIFVRQSQRKISMLFVFDDILKLKLNEELSSG